VFNNNKKQFINILQQNKQLKINYKIIQEDKIIKEENSAFLLTNENLPEDAKFKLNSLQSNINHSYLISLCESSNQSIVPTNSVDVINYDSVKVTESQSIIIPKNEINSIDRYFHETGIDYILSPYSILVEYLKQNAKINSLNFFIYNNIIYLVIYNNKKQLVYNTIKQLTPFESTQDATFLEDDIVGQKLYEEVNFLEIQQFLIDTVEDYYSKNVDVEFLEHIEMIYTLKPLSDSQLETLMEAMMIPIEYRAISLNTYIDDLVQREDSKIFNLIVPRIKKNDTNIYTWIILAFVSILLVLGVFNFLLDDKNNITNELKNEQIPLEKEARKPLTNQKQEPQEIETIEPAVASLPNHIQNNAIMTENIKMLFDIVPYDAILKNIEINKNSSTFVSNFIANSTSLADMQIKLNNIYSHSKVLLEHQNEILINTIIQNEKLKSQYDFYKTIEKKQYKRYNFLAPAKATDYIKSLSLNNSIITFDKKEHNALTTFYFSVVSTIKSPQEFFDFIESLNSQTMSIEIQYPIVFSKIENSLEVKYKIELHQANKKQVQLKK